MEKLLVLGLGNLLMNDDAAGLHAVYALQKRFPDRAELRVLDGGTLGLDLLGDIGWADSLLILDAIDMEAAPGTIAALEGEDIDTALATRLSPHQMGLKDILAAAELCEERPAKITLLGVQSESIAMAMTLSDAVREALPKLVEEAAKHIEEHLREKNGQRSCGTAGPSCR